MGLFDIFKKKREVYINPELPFENKFESDKTYEEIVAGVVAGDPESLFMMGCWHVGGAVVKQDLSKAVEYFTKAAKKGHALAQCELGVCYCNGDGVNIDIEEGVKWFEMSAAQGYAKAWKELCVSYNRCGVGCESLSDYNHIINSLKRAGYMPAYRTQAHGEYIRGNYAKVRKLYEQLVKIGDAEAACQLGIMYREGEIVKCDFAKSLQWYTTAMKMGSAQACNDVAGMCLMAFGLNNDNMFIKLALCSLELGSRWGNVDAMVQFGQLCYSGLELSNGEVFKLSDEVAKDRAKALELWSKAAELGDQEAADFLEKLNRGEELNVPLSVKSAKCAFEGDPGLR